MVHMQLVATQSRYTVKHIACNDDYLAMCYANIYHIVDTVNVS